MQRRSTRARTNFRLRVMNWTSISTFGHACSARQWPELADATTRLTSWGIGESEMQVQSQSLQTAEEKSHLNLEVDRQGASVITPSKSAPRGFHLHCSSRVSHRIVCRQREKKKKKVSCQKSVWAGSSGGLPEAWQTRPIPSFPQLHFNNKLS